MKTPRRISLLAAVLAALLLTTGFVPVLRVTAAWAASPVTDQAQKLYDSAKFTDAAALLRDALNTGKIVGNDAIGARALLGRCLVKAGNRLEAKKEFAGVLRQDPSFRPDAVMVPPDEMDVFNLALKENQDEQIRAGQRIPASISLFYGTGSGENKDFGSFVVSGGGKNKFDSQSEFGGSVRFPLKPRLSLDIELARFRATDKDSFPAHQGAAYEASAIPLIVSLYYNLMPRPKYHVNVFVGAGPLMASQFLLKLPVSSTASLNIGDQKQGTIIQGGLEGEYLLTPKFAISGRVLERSASAKDFFSGDNFSLYSSDLKLDGRKIDFSGFGAFIGLRAYIGY